MGLFQCASSVAATRFYNYSSTASKREKVTLGVELKPKEAEK
jgi:hypothetical protein